MAESRRETRRPLYARTRRSAWLRLIMAFFFLAISQAPAGAAGSDSDEILRAQYRRLKIRFESLVQQNVNPAVITCLAVETTAISWGLALADYRAKTVRGDEWPDKVIEFEKSWAASKDWDKRHLKALEFYHEAFETLITDWLTDRRQPRLQEELAAIKSETARQLAALEGRPDESP